MDLFCPHCTRRVTVPDDKASQVASCPLCAKQFMAPALAPTPAAPKPPAPPPAPVGSYGVGAAPVSPPSSVPPPSMSEPSPAAVPPSPPLPPGEYTRTLTFTLSDSWLSLVPLVCVVLIFVLSFFTWHMEMPPGDAAKNLEGFPDFSAKLAKPYGLWGLSFDGYHYGFMAYTILMLFPIGPLVIAGLLLDKGLAPPPLQPLLPWKSLLIGLLLGLTFLFLLFDYISAHFGSVNPIALAEKIAIRLHLLAMLASFGMFWLLWRRRRNLPLPKAEIRL
jgi:hypothetical protein